MKGIWHVLTRRKVLDEKTDLLKPSKLARRLNTYDLVALGVGSTLGLGVYVLAGHVAKDAAGPSVILSFLIAAIASLFAGLCYAEFGARVPRAGSAYVYSYVCVGEFIAFIIGWNLILEYVIGSASVSRGISLYLDTLMNDTLKTTFREIVPIHVSFMSDYFDLLAFGLAFLLGGMLAFGLKESAMVNNIFTSLNIFIVLFVIVVGAIKADTNNWFIVPDTTNSAYNVGKGGFFPFGFAGTLKGAATCFFGFVGFDCIATTGEEVHNPKKAIPLSIVTSLGIIFLAYFGISTVLTLMWPYYLQDANAPIPFAFGEVGWEWAKWTVAIGGIFGLIASLFGSLFPLPRILYAMASDGLVFRFFGDVSSRFHTPVFGTLLATLLTGIMAGLFELSHLVNMMSIGTLMAYTIVAACVLLLRYNSMYEPFDKRHLDCLLEDSNESYSLLDAAYYDEDYDETLYSMSQVFESDATLPVLKGDIIVHETSYLMNQHDKLSFSKAMKQLFNSTRSSHPSKHSAIIVGTLITLYCVFCVAFGLCLMYLMEELVLEVTWTIVITSLFGSFMVICVLLISLQPRSKTELSFQVPWVPLVPCISIFINIYLMLMLDATTWIRFGIWMAIGLPIYIASLYTYERGGNYLMHAQKTSSSTYVINGKLNYAFESTAECQERAVSFIPDYVEDREPTVASTRITSGILENKNIERYVRSNEFDERKTNGIGYDREMYVNKAAPESAIIPANKETDSNESIKEEQSIDDRTVNATNGNNDEDKITNYEEIELLDQVIKDEEEAAGMSPVLEHTDFEIHPIPSPSSPSSSGDGDCQLVSSEHSVVALVHRENTMTGNKDSLRYTSLTHGEDNVSVLNEIFKIQFDDETEKLNDDQTIKTKQVFVPPPPPPMDNEYFSNSSPGIQFKVVRRVDDLEDDKQKHEEKVEKRETKIGLKSETQANRKSDINISKKQERKNSDSNIDIDGERLKFGTDKQNMFMTKLDAILGKRRARTSSRINVISMTNIDTKNDESPANYVEKHKSEPDLVTALRKERAEMIMNRNDENNTLANQQTTSSHHLVQETDILSSNKVNDKHHNNNDVDEESLQSVSKENIKLKLEALFSSGQNVVPPTIRRKNWNSAYETNEEQVDDSAKVASVEDSEIIKPKKKENYTNTMKLQRERFGDVLKSIEMKNRDSDISLDNNNAV